MKYVKETRRKNFSRVGLAVLCFILSIVFPKVLSLVFPGLFKQHSALLTVLCVLLFWALGIVLFAKNFKRFLMTEALVANEKAIQSDRNSFPSASGAFDMTDIRAAFEKDGFTLHDEHRGFTATKHTKACDSYVAATSCGDLSFFREPEPSKKKSIAVIKIYLCDGITEEQKSTAKTVDGMGRFAVLTVYADRATGLAYYNGDTFDAAAPETCAQEIILHNVLLRDALPPKTEKDKTQAQADLADKDIRELLNELSHPADEETAVAKSLADGELRTDIHGQNGCFYYRIGKNVISHPFFVNDEGVWIITELSYVMTVYPKIQSAKKNEIAVFKDILEKELAEKNISYRYQ